MKRPKHKTLRRRLRAVRRELHAVESDIEAVRAGRPPAHTTPPHSSPTPGRARKQPAERTPADPPDPAPGPAGPLHLRDERFADYLASSIGATGPLRHERIRQRNKAIVVGGLVLILLAWLLASRWL